jgi:endonuclease/exonuclease/phosphatase family metal-dependent hydrolase
LLLGVLCWNVFHGRDAPPNPRLRKTAWRFSGKSLDDGVYLGVNHSLEREFARFVCSSDWSVSLLQEAPPAWEERLGERCGAEVFASLTARNQLGRLTQLIASWRPDLLGSWEGGSNMTLARRDWTMVAGTRRTLLLSSLRERGLSERRRMTFVRVRHSRGSEVSVANLHATERSKESAERELLRAAAAATEWANETPLVLGGDFNVRPRSSAIFAKLEREFGLAGASGPDAIDHILARGLVVERPPRQWAAERREVEIAWQGGHRRLRLSDHAPVEAVFRVPDHGSD